MIAVAVGLLSAPPSASAAEQCLFQGTKVTARNRATVERSLLCLTNLHRFRNGLPAYKRDTRLGAAARGHSADMVARGFFDHTNPDGLGPSSRVMAAGYPGGAGENIAANGTGTAASLFTQWKNSSGHNANMLGDYRAAGMGVAAGFPGNPGPGSITGTQNLGFAAANTGDTGLSLYASSDKCAKAKTGRLRIKAAIRKGKKKDWGPALARLKKTIRRRCKPLR
jgi:hypothetical protein